MSTRIELILFALSILFGVSKAVYVANPIPPLELKRCGYLTYTIPANTFKDETDGDTRHLTLTLRNLTGEVLNVNWLTLSPENQTLTAVLTDSHFREARQSQKFNFHLFATTRRGESAFATIELNLMEPAQNTTVAFLVNFAWIAEHKPPIPVILRIFADKFTAYVQENVNNLRFTHVVQDSVGVSIGISNCTTGKKACNSESVQAIKSKLYNDKGTQPQFRQAMVPEMYISYIQISLSAVCQPPEPPRVLKPYPVITLNPCSVIFHRIPYDVFYDEVDGYNLQLVIQTIDGKAIETAKSWLAVNGGENILYGVVTDQAIREEPQQGYNVTIRAYDSQYLWAETSMIVKIAKRSIQRYYQYTLHLSLIGNEYLAPIIEQNTVVHYMNQFLKANTSNLMSYNVINSKDFTLRSSICTLPLKCDNSTFSAFWKQLVTPEGTPKSELKAMLSTRYTIRAVTAFIDPICLQELDPPAPSINPWIVPITQCGGFQTKVPADMFYDKQDGNTRNLKLQLFTSDNKHISENSWVQLNVSAQTLYGLPTQEDINAYKSASQQFYKLVATDRSGMNASLQLRFVFQEAPPSTYTYKIAYTQSGFQNNLAELYSFKSKLVNYLGYGLRSSVGVKKIVRQGSTSRRIDYQNCSSLFDPCNVSQVERVNSRLFTGSFASSEFKRAMQPEFSILFLGVENTSDCHANTPPRVLHPVQTIMVSVCGILKYTLPAHLFYDKEDGYAKDLALSIADSSNKTLSKTSWLQLNRTALAITFAATVSLAETKERQRFILTATDRHGLRASTHIYTSINGPLQVLKDCQIKVKFQIEGSLSGMDDVYLTERIVFSMQSYFQLKSASEIGLVSVVRESASLITIAWSYCSSTYMPYTKSYLQHQMVNNNVDFKGLSFVLLKVFVPGTFLIHPGFKSAFQGLTVLSVMRIFTGKCSSFPPIIGLNRSGLVFNVTDCGNTKIPVGKNWFYDLEDGNAHQLTLKFLNKSHKEITDLENWINLDKTSNNILLSITDKERKQGISKETFYLVATDSSGLSTTQTLTINIKKAMQQEPKFEIHFYFINKGLKSYLNDSVYLSDKIAEAFSLSSGQDVLIKSYREDNGYVHSSILTWSSCYQTSCSSSTLQQMKNYLQSGTLFNSLKSRFLPSFDLQRASFYQSCSGTTTPPTSQTTKLTFNVNMCGVSVLKLPSTLFSDSSEGLIRNLNVYLLDESKKYVTASSWIQLNVATLQLYAIPTFESQLHNKVAKLHVAGVNSQNLSRTVPVDVRVSEEPYTNDCPITIVFKRKYGKINFVDLGILYHLLRVISNFYNDNQVKIKVLQYKKLTSETYSLKYSNCSFTFSSKEEAKEGYSESFRSTINNIFFKIVNRDGSVNSAFSKFMSTFFEIINIKISYECIEYPPYPTIGVLHRTYAQTCREFRDFHTKAMFNDARDGTNLKYSLTYSSGEPISPNEWITFDEKQMQVYGMVTEEVKKRAPFLGYEYRIVATDSSGRSANITYLIKIASALPHLPIKLDMAYESSFNESTPSATVLTGISRRIAGYLYGSTRGDDVMITSHTAGKSITFGLCSLGCSQLHYVKVATKLQATIYGSEPATQFVSAASGTFVPKNIYMDGVSCLPTSSVKIVTTRVVVLNWQKVCGFVDYKIPDDTFSDNAGRTTKDFFLSMYNQGDILSPSSAYHFDAGYHSFYGLMVASTTIDKRIYDLHAKHPESGHTAHTSFTLNIQDFDKFQTSSKSLCVVTATFTTQFNPVYSDFYIIKKFMSKLAGYLKSTVQEIQIITYSRVKQYPVKMSVSFANCQWYSWISAASNSEMLQRYTSSRSETLQKCFESLNRQTVYSASFSQAMMPDFQLTEVSSNEWCKRSPNKPPTVNMTVIRIIVRPCTTFSKQIPENAFVDEDGNTKSLSLKLYHEDGSLLTASDWVSFNTATQVVYGTPSRQAQSSNNGVYRYTLLATDKYGLSANSTVSIQIAGSAPGNENPKILIENYKVTLGKCGIYRRALPENFATDKEDGTMRNLRVELKMIDGSSLPRDSWVQFDRKTFEIYSLAESGSSKSAYYNVIVSDSCGGTATTQIQISTETTQGSYYSHLFEFQSLLGSNATYLHIQIKFLELLSKYFGQHSEQYRRTVFVKKSSSEVYEFGFSNCSTGEYVCQITDRQYNTKQTIFKGSVGNVNSFATFISSSFRITSYQNSSKYTIDLPPNNSSSAMTDIEVKSCGGYSRGISRNYFEDRESPANVRYAMTLTNGAAVPLNYPIQIQGNFLQIIPMGSTSNGLYQARITAFDRCNQTSYRDFKVTISIPNSVPGYQVQFTATVNSNLPAVYYISQFKESLYSQIADQNYRIAISSYSKVGSSLNIKWSSCNEIYYRCNKTDITYLHLKLFTSTNITDQNLVSRLQGNFSNPRLTEYYKNCNFSSPEPPVSRQPVEISVDLCRRFEFRIPVDTFYDPEDGSTRNLYLSLLTTNNLRIPEDHWLQFNRTMQQVYGYPRYPSKSAFQRTYEYILFAKDIQGNQASSRVTASIRGSTEITYKLTMKGRLAANYHTSNIDIEIMLIKRIAQFFSDSAINDISFIRTGNTFTFSWSFCRMQTATCNCFYIKHAENRLANIQEFRKTIGSGFTVEKVVFMRYGVCNKTSTPQILIKKRNVILEGGQFFSSYIHNNQYYDLEDGYTKNLTIFITDSQNKVVTSSHWIRVEQQYICGLVLLSQLQDSEWTNSNKRYDIVVRDACGKEVRDSFSVVMSSHQEYLSYTIRMYFANSYQSIKANCTKIQRFVALVSSYLNINSSDVFIQNMYVHNKTANYTSSLNNYTVIVWGTRNLTVKNCKNETVQSFRESFMYQNGSINKAFYQYMKSDFDVVEVNDDNSSCSNGTFVPLIVPSKSSDFDFPFWILILLLILAILILLCWCCWICIPRCCAGCCVGCVEKHCVCCRTLCGKCCIPGGKYASLDEEMLVPDDVEQGVLSNARTAPEATEEKFGMEAAPDDGDSGVMANSGSEPDSFPSKIEEDEAKMEQEAMPIYYTAPDYLTTQAASTNSIDDNFDEKAQAQGSAPLPADEEPVSSGLAPMTNDIGDNLDEEAPAQGSAPLPFNEEPVSSGVAPMPFEEPQDETKTMPSEDESSISSTRNLISEDIMSASDLPSTQQSSLSEESHSKFSESGNEATFARGSDLSLPTVPNVYSEPNSEAREVRRSSVMTSHSESSTERRFPGGAREAAEGRRVSVTRPVRLVLPRQSVTSVGDIGFHEVNNNNFMSSADRRGSQVMLLDNDEMDDNSFQGRRESRVIIRDSRSNGNMRRASAVQIVSSDGSLVDEAPIRLKMTEDGVIRDLPPWQRAAQETQTIRRVSRVSNGHSSTAHRDVMDDTDIVIGRRASVANYDRGEAYRDIPTDFPTQRRISRVSVSSKRASTAFHPDAHNYSDYSLNGDIGGSRRVSTSNRRASTALQQSPQRRVSRTARRKSLQQPFTSIFADSNTDSHEYGDVTPSRRKSTHFLGYESDSTDSGYAVTRQSKRYRRRSQDISRSPNNLDQDGDPRKNSVQVRRKSVTRVSNGGTQNRRTSRGQVMSRDVEMWSRDHQGNMNVGYESDSYV